MKLLYDFFPVILFFATYAWFTDNDIYLATGVAIAAAFIQVAGFWLKHRRFEKMHLVSLGILVVLGGMTLAFRDDTFIKWKPTAINWLFAIGFLISQFVGGKTLVERMLGSQVTLPSNIWTRLNLSWVAFFLVSGALNIYVAYHFSQAAWVYFKLFGLLGLTLVFVFIQAIYLARYMPRQEVNEESD
jgi:intracellular septation protein